MAQTNILRETCAYWKAEKQFEWKVGNFNNLPRVEGYVVNSERFDFHHAEWYLQLYPNGKPEYNCPGIIKIFLSLKKEISVEDHHVRYRMGIKKADDTVVEKSKEVTFKKESGGHSLEFIERSDLLNPEYELVDQDGILTIYFSISNEGDLRNPPSDDFATLYEHLKDPDLDGLHKVITIKAESKEFVAHKCFLAARSKFFADKFKNETLEENDGIIELSGCDPDTFELFLLFLYTTKFDKVSSSEVERLYKVAHKYLFEGLKEECSRHMARELSNDSVLHVLNLAIECDDSNLIDIATEFHYRSNRKSSNPIQLKFQLSNLDKC